MHLPPALAARLTADATLIFAGHARAARYLRPVGQWQTIDTLLRHTEDAVRFAVGEGLPVMYVTEDTTRCDPEMAKRLYSAAINCGARAIVVCDNTQTYRDAYADYLAFINDPVNGFRTMTLPFDGGLELSVRCPV